MELSDLKNKKVAILGLGYIGSNILEYLKANDIKSTVITRDNISIIEKEEFDYLINASGNSGDFRQQLIETIESNLSLNSYILENAKIKHSYIYLSSTRVYGFTENETLVFDENFINSYNHLNLDFIYDGSKKLAESLLFNYANKVNFKIAILRLSNVYGSFDSLDDATLIKKIIRYKKSSNNTLSVKQNRYSTKDYIHIDDVVCSIVKIMMQIEKTDAYNLAYGKSYSLDDISKILNLEIATDEMVKLLYSRVSNSKLKEDFDIEFKYSFEDGLKNTILEGR